MLINGWINANRRVIATIWMHDFMYMQCHVILSYTISMHVYVTVIERRCKCMGRSTKTEEYS